MKCSFCGYRFKEREGRAMCKSCPIALGNYCSMIKCPRCSYELPVESKLLNVLKKWRKRKWK